MNKFKIFTTIGLLLIIIIAVIFLIFNKDTAFTNKIEVDYPDGCTEVYINTKLQGDKCDYEEIKLNYSMELGI